MDNLFGLEFIFGSQEQSSLTPATGFERADSALDLLKAAEECTDANAGADGSAPLAKSADGTVEVKTVEPGALMKFVPFTKVDSVQRLVSGVVTAELPDKAQEVCDYEKSKPFYMAWSEEIAKASGGKNVGNLRVMHGLTAAGAGKSIEFRDDKKEIAMCFKVVDDDAWKKVQEGVLTGFSHGGRKVGDMVPDPVFKGCMRYVANPIEISLVDAPCLASARFEYVKADGTSELRKFAKTEKETPMDHEAFHRAASQHHADLATEHEANAEKCYGKAEGCGDSDEERIKAAGHKEDGDSHSRMAKSHAGLSEAHSKHAEFHAEETKKAAEAADLAKRNAATLVPTRASVINLTVEEQFAAANAGNPRGTSGVGDGSLVRMTSGLLSIPRPGERQTIKADHISANPELDAIFKATGHESLDGD